MEKITKRKRSMITLELKKEIVSKYENGLRISDLANQYRMPKTTVATILRNKDAIKEADVAKGVTILTKRRPQALEEMEKLLLIWINEKQVAGDIISESLICEKAKRLHADLIADVPGASAESFKASHGWFEKFKRRTGIHSVVRHSEAASANKLDADNFVLEFKNHVTAQDFVPQQVFNYDEKGFFWKKMPKRTFITREEIVSLGNDLGLEVSDADVEELLEGHKTELTTQELQSILIAQQKEAAEENVSSEEEEEEESRESVSTAEIKETLAKWGEMQAFVEKYHPDRVAANHATNTFENLVMSHFKKILRERQKQIYIEPFLVRKTSSDSEPGGSGAKRPREGMAEEESVIMIVEDDPESEQ